MKLMYLYYQILLTIKMDYHDRLHREANIYKNKPWQPNSINTKKI
ncbi:MAG: hypothetical protein PSX81_01090 [bacterium]|nr:hypothetical protein [bacterium]